VRELVDGISACMTGGVADAQGVVHRFLEQVPLLFLFSFFFFLFSFFFFLLVNYRVLLLLTNFF
jgi:hypothetical protein